MFVCVYIYIYYICVYIYMYIYIYVYIYMYTFMYISAAQKAQARFDKAGFLSAVPWCWPPTSRQEDETQMVRLFAGQQARNDKRGSLSMSSEAMQQALRLFGLFNVTASACDVVSGP